MYNLPHIDRWIHGDHDIMPDVEVPMKFVCEFTNPEFVDDLVMAVEFFSEETLEKINKNLERKGTKARWRFKLDSNGNRVPDEEGNT